MSFSEVDTKYDKKNAFELIDVIGEVQKNKFSIPNYIIAQA